MKVTYYPCACRMRAGRKSLVREVKTNAKPETALGFDVPEGSTLPEIVQELARHAKPLAVHIWIDGQRVGALDDVTRKMTIKGGQHVVLIQDLSGDAFHGLSWIVCAEAEELAEESA